MSNKQNDEFFEQQFELQQVDWEQANDEEILKKAVDYLEHIESVASKLPNEFFETMQCLAQVTLRERDLEVAKYAQTLPF